MSKNEESEITTNEEIAVNDCSDFLICENFTDEILDQLIEMIDEYDKITNKEYITLNELKVYIKDFETFDTKDKIQEIITKIDILLNNYVESTAYDNIANITETEDDCVESSIKNERTDKNLIPDNMIEINQDAVDIFEDVLAIEHNSNARLDIFFSDSRCKDINQSWIKDKTNPYTLDPYGLVIRKKQLNKTGSEYGWRYDEFNRPVHIAIKNTCTREENINNVLNIQYQKNKKAFDKKGIIYQIYSKYFPERLTKFNQNL